MMNPVAFTFYVVELQERSLTEPDKYVCIPLSWIRFRETSDGAVLIKYPIEEPSETKKRVKKGEECSDDWEIYSAEVKLGTNSYIEANEYIKILNKMYTREHESRKEVEIGVLPTLDTSSSTANEAHPTPALLKGDIEPVSNQTSGQLQQTAAKVEVKADETTDSSPNAKRYFTRQRSKMSLAANTASSLDQTMEKKSQKTSRCVEQTSKIPLNEDNNLLAVLPKMLTDVENMRVPTRKDLGPNAKHNLELLHAVIQKLHMMVQNLQLMFVQFSKKLTKMIELLDDNDNNEEVSTDKNMIAVKDKISESQNDGDGDDDEYNNEEDEDDVPLDKIRGQARKFTLPPEYDPGDSTWTLKHKEQKQGLVELSPGSHIYVHAMQLSNCKRMSKDSKTLARMLLVEVFSESALSVCSLTGRKANAFDLQGLRVRPGLDGYARNVLLNYVEDHALKQKWVTLDKHTVLNSLRNKIQEMRGKSRNRKNSESLVQSGS